MDPIKRGLFLGVVLLAVALAATMMLGRFMEQRVANDIDQTYSPAHEATVDRYGWPSTEGAGAHGSEPAGKRNSGG